VANRDAVPALRYHDATKHSIESIRNDRHFLDWDNLPLPFKVYTTLEPEALPRDFEPSSARALDAIGGDGDAPGSGPTLGLGLLAHLLYFTAGVLRRRPTPIGETYFRAAACTGNLHHIELYVVCASLPDLPAGVYHFGAHDFALRCLRVGDHRGHLIAATGVEPRAADAPVVLAFTSTFWRNAWKYRARAYRHSFWDSGTLLANLLAVAAARALPAHLILGFVDDTVDRLLDVDPEREAPLGLVALGRGAPPPVPSPPVAPLALDVLPLSAEEVRYPAIRAAHAAGALTSADEVIAWRRALDPGTPPTGADEALADHLPGSPADDARPDGPAGHQDTTTTVVPLPVSGDASWPSEPIERVIRRRGSARAFTRDPIPFASLATILRTATRGISADFLPPGARRAELYLIAHAVDGLSPGAYVYDRDRESLLLLRAGSFRREAGLLGLGQEIPADAAANVYWLTDIRAVLARLGSRGYRAAQLEAAIGGGRTYLAAYALGLGASGLTFFDDDVSEFFSPDAAGKSVMFLMAVGVPQRLRRDSRGG
jgi:SagB-type dehydrogenase family enzyme